MRSFLNSFTKPKLMDINMGQTSKDHRCLVGHRICDHFVVAYQVKVFTKVKSKLSKDASPRENFFAGMTGSKQFGLCSGGGDRELAGSLPVNWSAKKFEQVSLKTATSVQIISIGGIARTLPNLDRTAEIFGIGTKVMENSRCAIKL